MEKLGEYLKAAREKKGRSLSDIAEKTRISLSFLEALENDDYRAIPGDVFVSGFLRSYARELGLSQKEVMSRFRQTVGEEKAGYHEETPMPPVLKKVVGKKRSSRLAYTGVAVIAALLAVYLLTDRGEKAPPPAEEVPAATQTAKEPVKTPEEAVPAQVRQTAPEEAPMPEKAVEPEAAAETEKEASTGKKPSPAAEKGINLKLTASEQTWFHMTIDDVKTTDAILEPGETVEFKANRKILLDLGNAGGVEIQYNGKTLKPFGPAGTVRKILFTPEKAGVVHISPKPEPPAPMKDRSLGPA